MSSLQFAPGEYLDGSAMRDMLGAISNELVRRGYPALRVVSGTRLYSTQERIFRERYVPASQVNGRHVYDFTWWNGVLWARISSAGRVAPPSHTAPHVAHIAADLGYPYNVYGVSRNAMLQVIRDLGLEGQIVNNGTGFGEVWHWESRRGAGVIGTPAGGGSSPFDPAEPIPKEWDEMASKEEIAAAFTAAAEKLLAAAIAANSVQVYEWQAKDSSVKAMIAAPGVAPIHIQSATERDVLKRFFNGREGIDRFNSAEHNIIAKWMPLLGAKPGS